jgi:hypothetical protein
LATAPPPQGGGTSTADGREQAQTRPIGGALVSGGAIDAFVTKRDSAGLAGLVQATGTLVEAMSGAFVDPTSANIAKAAGTTVKEVGAALAADAELHRPALRSAEEGRQCSPGRRGRSGSAGTARRPSSKRASVKRTRGRTRERGPTHVPAGAAARALRRRATATCTYGCTRATSPTRVPSRAATRAS